MFEKTDDLEFGGFPYLQDKRLVARQGFRVDTAIAKRLQRAQFEILLCSRCRNIHGLISRVKIGQQPYEGRHVYPEVECTLQSRKYFKEYSLKYHM